MDVPAISRPRLPVRPKCKSAKLTNLQTRALDEFPLVHQQPTKKPEHPSDEQADSWTVTIPGIRTPVLRFQCSALSEPPAEPPAQQLHMTYKTMHAETKLLTAVLQAHGMGEVDNECLDFNLLWTGIHPKPHTLRAMGAHQRVNHFPRSYELTRKDRLSKNIEKMQHAKGSKHFDFIPQTFVIPVDYRELCSAHYRTRGPWIVKPVASSRGRGIYIVNSPDQVALEETVVVAKYIDNPLLVDGHKCDLRLYVAVTSYDPLLIYIYEEGLVRFAAVKYDTGGKHLWNPCMHLCNYSINKYHSDYIKSEDPDAEDVGHKWTLSGLLRHLRTLGQDTACLMQRIEELVVKSILAAAPPIISAVKMFVPHTSNCFELYGFDILVDSSLKPWLLEVNLSPSLGCDSLLDTRVKSAMLADLLTLVGVPAVDPMLRAEAKLRNKLACRRVQSADPLSSVGVSSATLPATKPGKKSTRLASSALSLTAEESRLVRVAQSEFERRGGFVRVFPTAESWNRYSGYLDPSSGITITVGQSPGSSAHSHMRHNYNQTLHRQLFPELDLSLLHSDRIGQYEQALGGGHRSSLDCLIEDSHTPAVEIDTKREICQCLHDGSRFSQWQARRLFAQYLNCILRRVTGKNGPLMQDGQGDLVLRFLQRASYNLRTSYAMQTPSRQLEGKDRDAVVAKQLFDFIYMYTRETDLYSTHEDKPQFVPIRLLQPFLATAKEPELEEVLLLHTRLYKCSHAYLGRSGSTGLDMSGSIKPLGLLHVVSSFSSARRRSDCDCFKRNNDQTTSNNKPTKVGAGKRGLKVSRAL